MLEAAVDAQEQLPDTGAVRDDLELLLISAQELVQRTRPVYAVTMAEAQLDPEFGPGFPRGLYYTASGIIVEGPPARTAPRRISNTAGGTNH